MPSMHNNLGRIRPGFRALPGTRLHKVLLFAVACGFFSLAPLDACAQALPAARLPSQVVALQYMTTRPYSSSDWIYGLSGSVELKSNRWWGIETQASGEHWLGPTTRYFGGIGPQLVLFDGRFRFHAVALGGISRDRLISPSQTLTQAQYSAAIRAGGGVDFRVSRHWLLRIGEVYVTRSLLQPNVQSIDYSQGLGYVF